MQRIAIIGNAGGGKSALARWLGEKLNLPVYEVDQLQWRPGWVRTPSEEMDAVYEKWIGGSAWIIDGWGDWDVLRRRFDRADTIVVVDLPIALHYWWASKRQILAILGLSKGWPPPGCSAWPVTRLLYKTMRYIHREMRPQLLELVEEYGDRKRVVYLRSRLEIRRFREM